MSKATRASRIAADFVLRRILQDLFDILNCQSVFGDVLDISARLIVVVPNDLEELRQPLLVAFPFSLQHAIAIAPYVAIPTTRRPVLFCAFVRSSQSSPSSANFGGGIADLRIDLVAGLRELCKPHTVIPAASAACHS